jgi:hypothetical protein
MVCKGNSLKILKISNAFYRTLDTTSGIVINTPPTLNLHNQLLLDHLPYVGSWRNPYRRKKSLVWAFSFSEKPIRARCMGYALSRYRAGGLFTMPS